MSAFLATKLKYFIYIVCSHCICSVFFLHLLFSFMEKCIHKVNTRTGDFKFPRDKCFDIEL